MRDLDRRDLGWLVSAPIGLGVLLILGFLVVPFVFSPVGVFVILLAFFWIWTAWNRPGQGGSNRW